MFFNILQLINANGEKLYKVFVEQHAEMQQYKDLCTSDSSLYRWYIQKVDSKTWKFITEINAYYYEEHIRKNIEFQPYWVVSKIWEASSEMISYLLLTGNFDRKQTSYFNQTK